MVTRMAKIKIIARSGLYFFLFVLGILFFALLILAAWPLSTLAWRRRMAQVWSRYNRRILALACGLRVRISGLENLPPPPFVILSKHQSAWETVSLHAVFPVFVLVLKESLTWIPLFGWSLRATGQIPIDRSQGIEAVRKLHQAGKKEFDRGVSVLIFPEGTRTPPGTVGHYNAGGVGLAMSAGVPIVPVAHDAGYYWGRRAFLKRPGVIRLRIGPSIPTADRKKSDRKVLLGEVRERIEGMMAEIATERSAEGVGQSDELAHR